MYCIGTEELSVETAALKKLVTTSFENRTTRLYLGVVHALAAWRMSERGPTQMDDTLDLSPSEVMMQHLKSFTGVLALCLMSSIW